MPISAWPEWLPDQADFANPGSPVIKNCIPLTARSYGPMPSAVPHSENTLRARCQGSYSIKDRDGSVYVFAGDRTDLYQMPPGTTAFIDASWATGDYATPSVDSAGGFWSMTSFGTQILATNGVDPIQTTMLGDVVGGFEALQPGDPVGPPIVPAAPKARFLATVKDFLFVADTTDPVDGHVPYRVWWSSINDPSSWPQPGTIEALQVQSDFQDLQQTDLGNITGLVSGFAPGADAVIFCERGIWTAAYAGPPLIFSFRVAQGASGTLSPLSIVQDHAQSNAGIRPVVYYLGGDGFAAFDGSASYPIGAQKFDKAFFRELDDAYLNYVQGVADPRSRSILWGFPSVGSGGLFNRMLVYNWELSRGSIVELEPGQWLEWLTTAMYGSSYNLDSIDSFGTLETISPSFDDPFWTGNAAGRLTMFDEAHRLNIGGGPAMAPTLETGEMQPAPGRRGFVQMTRPLNDGGAATIAVGHRERLTDPVIWEPPVAINQIGECPQRCTGRYVRFRMAMPAGQDFRHLQGIDATVLPEASRR